MHRKSDHLSHAGPRKTAAKHRFAVPASQPFTRLPPPAALSDRLPAGDSSLYVWADLDYGGFNILAQIRRKVSRRVLPYQMETSTLERFAQFVRPLTPADRHNLERIASHYLLQDVRPVIEHLSRRGLKLEQEAIVV